MIESETISPECASAVSTPGAEARGILEWNTERVHVQPNMSPIRVRADEAVVQDRRIPELDALRGLACLLILVYHFKPHLFPGGWAAVDLFFVLSGYLITSIILTHSHQPRFLRDFYIRRGLRIWPIYYLTVLILAGAATVLPRTFDFIALPSLLTYTQNVSRYWSDSAPEFAPYLTHLWSLAVEEQFYLIWPLALCAVGRRGVVPLSLALLVTSVVARSCGLHWWLLLARGDGLALGALIAAARPDAGTRWPWRSRIPFACAILAAGICVAWLIANGAIPPIGTPKLPALSVLAVNVLAFGVVGTVLCFQGSPWLAVLRPTAARVDRHVELRNLHVSLRRDPSRRRPCPSRRHAWPAVLA